ncbi:sensor histidine kinase [Thalassobacillus hwangdonensis]|uniref:histidine kinase n=1 Tax=Thalassobacillus hwangdonensis TaxID=546108 RepID=A0ABW3L1Q1_9BACI
MIREYIRERLSWISLVIGIHGLFLFVGYLDSSIPFQSMGYVVFLSSILFVVFLVTRYYKETKFYKQLNERINDLDATSVLQGDLPFEKMTAETLTDHMDVWKREITANNIKVEQEKEEMLAWIHEVKTPLTAIHLMIDRVEDQDLKRQLTYEWLRIHFLLDQQLHQKRIGVIENDLYIEPVDLKEVVFGEIRTLQSWCIQKGIGFDIDLQVKEVLSDSKWLAFIIRQLLSNAVKYSSDGDITVSSYEISGEKVMKIEDHGVGIDAKDLPRIFEKGFTSTARKEAANATGMGLYLTQKAAKPLLISIDVDSTVGSGTIVTLTFPKRNDFVDVIGM